MTAADEKKLDEFLVMESFREIFPEFPKGKLYAAESPDFILSLGPRKKIGIELVRLHLRPSRKDPYSYENLLEIIGMKEDKMGLYRKRRLEFYWLILVARDPAYQPSFSLRNKLLKWTFRTSFDRIFLYDLAGSEILELYLDPKG
jgi:hypothetical protein